MTVFKEITNEDIYKTLQEVKELGVKTHEQACRTNGRVSILEDKVEHLEHINNSVAFLKKKSLGVWIANHPFRFAIITLIIISILLSDIRHPLFNFLISLL